MSPIVDKNAKYSLSSHGCMDSSSRSDEPAPPSSPVVAHECENARSFLNRLRDCLKPHVPLGCAKVFRGQADPNVQLLPQVFRIGAPVPPKPVVLTAIADAQDCLRNSTLSDWPSLQDAPADLPVDKWHQIISEVGAHAFGHANLVRNFALLAQRAGFPVRLPDALWHLANPNVPTLFRLLSGDYGRATDDREMEPFTLGQHHDLPTFLLDWSFNPLVAAFWAVTASMKYKTNMAVWVLDEEYLNAPSAEIKRITVLPTVNPFLDAQKGLFTWDPKAYRRQTAKRYIPFDEIIFEEGKQEHLTRYTLAASQANSLFDILWSERVTWAHVMPTLNSVVKDLELYSGWARRTI